MSTVKLLSSTDDLSLATPIELLLGDTVGWPSLSREYEMRFPRCREDFIRDVFAGNVEAGKPFFNGGIVLPTTDLKSFEQGIAAIISQVDKWQTYTLYINLTKLGDGWQVALRSLMGKVLANTGADVLVLYSIPEVGHGQEN